jgi:hypothetical protein
VDQNKSICLGAVREWQNTRPLVPYANINFNAVVVREIYSSAGSGRGVDGSTAAASSYVWVISKMGDSLVTTAARAVRKTKARIAK